MYSPIPRFALLCCVLVTGAVVFCPLLQAQTEPARYTGSDACVACHEDVAGNIADSAHGQLGQEAEAQRRGCESCHGAGSNHVNSGGDKSLVFTFKGASPAAIGKRCGQCHEGASDSIHTHRATSCLSCHAAHHYRQKKFLLVDFPPQLCTDCHNRRGSARQ